MDKTDRKQSTLQILHEGDKAVIWKDLPVMLDKSTLLIDRERNQVYVSCEFRNIGQAQVSAVMIEVKCKDIWGSALDANVSHQYLDLAVNRGETFGHGETIALSDQNARNITVEVKKVLLADGTVLNGTDVCCTLPVVKTLEAHFGDAGLAEQYARATTSMAEVVPEIAGDYWRCTCGMVWDRAAEQCEVCGSTPEQLRAALDADQLKEALQAYRAQQQAEEERQKAAEAERIKLEQEEAEQKKRQKEQEALAAKKAVKKKRLRIGCTIAAVILVIVIAALACGIIFFGIPYYKYRNACTLLEQCRYDEAQQVFVELDGFLNSEEFVPETLYRKAESLLRKKDYDAAIKQYQALNGYKDSAQQIKAATYGKAEMLLGKGEYEQAIEIYQSLGDYEDCVEKINLANYNIAEGLMKANKYDKAYEMFVALGDYKDAKACVDDCVGKWAADIMSKGSSVRAGDFNRLVKLEEHQYDSVYQCVVKELTQRLDPYDWRSSYAHTAYNLLSMLPSSYQDTQELLDMANAFRNGVFFNGSSIKENRDLIERLWKYKLVQNAVTNDYVVVDFLEGKWKAESNSYYIRFKPNDDGTHTAEYTLPFISKPKGTKYFNIVNMSYIYEDASGKELAKVYDFKMIDCDTMEVYCYKNKKTYTMKRQ